MPDVIGTTLVQKARKEHVCNFCAQKIKRGETYERSRLVYDGSAYTWKNHMHCMELARHFNMFDHCDDEGVTQDDFVTSIWEIYRDYHPEVQWDKGTNIPKAMEFCIELMKKGKSEKEVKHG